MGGTNQGIWKQKILIRFPSLHNITPGCIAIIWLICNMSFSFPLLYSIHSYIGQGKFHFYWVNNQFYSLLNSPPKHIFWYNLSTPKSFRNS